ncbi:MAG: site-2 protease family protein [Lentisphaeria bacterium]|nr:site-2 protease family protein [Lentisphaeria bacterium]
MFIVRTLFNDPYHFFMIFLIVVFSVCLHEFFHAWAAVTEGDESLRDHLTLNPLKQMGVMSIIMFLFLGIAWGSVPVRKDVLRGRKSLLKIALAGPAANMLLYLIAFVLLFCICKWADQGDMEDMRNRTLLLFTVTMGVYNFVLLLFNLLPVPGLDGWHILKYFFPDKMEIKSEWVKGIMAGVILGAIFIIPYIFKLGYFVLFKSVAVLLQQ